MDPARRLSRRRLLAGHATALGLVAAAGCADRGGTEPTDSDDTDGTDGTSETDDSETDGTDGTSETDDSETDGPDDTSETDDSETSESDDLDLREANVVGVALEGETGTYDFDVTLHHDDDGEDGYANWWQVERLDGTRLGRRDLAHPHSRQPFTRSETIEIPDEASCVVVRGHDQTHGYGGVAAVVDLGDGAVRSVDQGSERRSFDAGDCP